MKKKTFVKKYFAALSVTLGIILSRIFISADIADILPVTGNIYQQTLYSNDSVEEPDFDYQIINND